MIKKIKKFIENLGIEIRENPDVTIARTFFFQEKGKFVIEVNPDFKNEDAVYEHELLHIYRFDFFVQDKDVLLWNIASDIIINSILLSAGRINEKIQKIVLTKCPFCEFSVWRSGAEAMYYHILSHQENAHNCSIPNCYIPIPDNENAKREANRIKKQILDDFAKNEYVPDSIERYISEKVQQNNTEKKAGKSNTEFSIVVPSPSPNPLIRKILSFVSEKEGSSEFLRRYELYRNNRNPLLKREFELTENTAILFVIDVSGSMEKYIPTILSAIRFFEKECTVEKIFFSDNIKYVQSRRYFTAKGGTSFLPVLHFLQKQKKKYSVICIFSDFEFSDISKESAIQRVKEFAKEIMLFKETDFAERRR